MSKLVQSKDYDIRYSYEGDYDFLFDLLSHKEVNKWFPINIETGAPLFAKNWIFYAKYLCSLTCLYKKKPCAIGVLFLMPYKKVAHLAMGYMAVHPSMQRKGIGTSLLKNLQHLGKTKFHLESIHFEVFEYCPIIPLLKKQGFAEIIRQERYVILDKKERARIVMEKWLDE